MEVPAAAKFKPRSDGDGSVVSGAHTPVEKGSFCIWDLETDAESSSTCANTRAPPLRELGRKNWRPCRLSAWTEAPSVGLLLTDSARGWRKELWDCLMMGLRCFRYLRSSQGRSHTSSPSRRCPTVMEIPQSSPPFLRSRWVGVSPLGQALRCCSTSAGTSVLW